MTRQTNPFGYSHEMLSIPCGRPLAPMQERVDNYILLEQKRNEAIAWMQANGKPLISDPPEVSHV